MNPFEKPTHATLMLDAYKWGRNWATLPGMPKSSEYVANAMSESWSFDDWKQEYRDEFWRGYVDGPHDIGLTIPVISRHYQFK